MKNQNGDQQLVRVPELLDDDDYGYEQDADDGTLMRQANDMIAANQQGLANVLSGALINGIDVAPRGFLQRMEARAQLRYFREVASAVRAVVTDARAAQGELNNSAKDTVDSLAYVVGKFRQLDIDGATHPYNRTLGVLEAQEQIQLTRMRMTGHRTVAAQRTAVQHVAQRAAAQERPENRPMTKEEQAARQAVIRGKNGSATVSAADLYTAFAALTYARYFEESHDSEDATDRAFQDVLFMVQTKGITEADARSYATQFEQEKKRMDAGKISNAQSASFAARFHDTRGKK